jgi:type IV secretion system protein TrbL
MEYAIQTIMEAVGKSSGVIEGIALFLVGLSACIVMSFALTTAIAYMGIILLENYILGSLGLILMGFGGSDYTRNYTLSYIRTLVHVGLKLFLATIIVQTGVIAFTQATMGLGGMSAESVSQTCMRLIAQSFFFLAVTRIIPEIAGALVSGTSSTGTHTVNAIRAGSMAAGAAIAGAAAGVYNIPGAAADGYVKNRNAVESAVNAYSSRFEQSLSKGNGPIRAGASALGGTLWSAYQDGRHTRRSNESAWKEAMSPVTPQGTEPRSPEPQTPAPNPATAAEQQDFGFKEPNL